MLIAMRQCIVMVALLGCAHAAPPWPKPTVSETDGGESLAPREAKSVVVAAKETKPEVKPEVAKPAPNEAKPATAVPAPAAEAAPAPPPSVPPIPDDEGEETIVIDVED